MNTPRISSLLKALALTAPSFMAPLCWADITGPYAADANTVYLFHLDEAAGSTTALNSGTAGFNATAYSAVTYPGNNVNAPADTSILGASAYSGFGNAANIATANQGLGIDFTGNGGFQLNANTTTAVGDLQANHSSILGANNAFTLEAMINLPTLGTGLREIISTDSAASSRGFQFRINAGNLEFNWIGSTPAGFTMAIPTTGDEAFAANEWFHVALSYDGVNNNVYWTRLDPSRTAATLLGVNSVETPNSASGMLLDIGNEGRSSGTSANSSEGLLGKIDEVRISNVARTPDQFVFAVPEPSPLALITLCGLCLVALRIRK